MLDIVEKFLTISGEAPILGHPIYLIRFSGCNLNCSYCDTEYKNEVKDNFTREELIEDICSEVALYPEIKILFTGGEPLLENRYETLYSIIQELRDIDFYIETNGSIKINYTDLSNCFYIVDWKSPSSGENDKFFMGNLKRLRINNDCIKFVITKEDFEWVKEAVKIVTMNNPFIPMYISAQYNKLSLAELADFIMKNRLPLKISIQLHKMIWPNVDRGV